MLTWRPDNLWPGGNTKRLALVQDYSNRMQIRGDLVDMGKDVHVLIRVYILKCRNLSSYQVCFKH